MDGLKETVKVKKVTGPDKDANFDFVIGVVDDVGVGRVMLGFKPEVMDTWIREVVMPSGISPM